MSEVTVCNKCGTEFIPDKSQFGEIKKDDLVVWYFSCPTCGEKYHVFTSNSEMRSLVEKRKAVQMKIRAAFTKKFQKKTIREYEQELDQIKKRQESIGPRLKRLGEDIIRGMAKQKT